MKCICCKRWGDLEGQTDFSGHGSPLLIECVICSWLPHGAQLVKITWELYWKWVKSYSLTNVKWELIIWERENLDCSEQPGRPEHCQQSALTDTGCNLWERYLLKTVFWDQKGAWEQANIQHPSLPLSKTALPWLDDTADISSSFCTWWTPNFFRLSVQSFVHLTHYLKAYYY